MTLKKPINYLTIKGFKSIRSLERLPLNAINVLIGANGAGKSNFISFFSMLPETISGRLQYWVQKQGGADRILSFGSKITPRLEACLESINYDYFFALESIIDERLIIGAQMINRKPADEVSLGILLDEERQERVINECHTSINSCKVYHFHDTSNTAQIKRQGAVHDNAYLRPDGANLAAFLLRIKRENRHTYEEICKIVQLAIPFFNDFDLRPNQQESGEENIALLWKQKDSDYPFHPSQLSDGSIRFIGLATALLQPDPPSTIIIDEPELGLHPYALTLLGALIRSASTRMQVIVSTQSVQLLNEFSVDDLIVVEREGGESVFKRLSEDDFKQWLENYTIGELWEKNVLGGRPKP